MVARRRFTLSQKTRILAEQSAHRLTNGEVCRRHNIQNHQLNEWKDAVERGRFISKCKKSVGGGMKSKYHEHEADLVKYIHEKRSAKCIVTIHSLIRKLSELCSVSTETTYRSRQMWAHRFLKRNRFSIRRITRNVTLSDVELEQRRISFLQKVEQQYFSNPLTVFVNMDQVSVVYGDAGRFTIDTCGATSIQVRTGESQSSRTTVALSVASTGEKLPPLVIFKGTMDGRVAREFSRTTDPYPQDMIYKTNQNAWMTEDAMLAWIEGVLVPFSFWYPIGSVCVVLDSFSIHLKDSIQLAIRNRNIPVIYIPGGLTGELQPLDVGINAPFKHYVHSVAIENPNFEGMTASQKRHSLACAISTAFSQISSDTVINSFNRMLFMTFDSIEDAEEIE
jgi:transposase-like protein